MSSKCLEALKAVSLSQVFSDYPLASGIILFLSKCIILVSLPVIILFILLAYPLVCLSCVLLLIGSVWTLHLKVLNLSPEQRPYNVTSTGLVVQDGYV